MPKGVYKHKILSVEHKRKISLSHIGLKYKKWSNESRKRASNAQKGKKHSIEQIKKTIKSRSWYKTSDETKRKIGLANSIAHKGKKHSNETKRKISKSHKGKHSKEKCPFWKGGITDINITIRMSLEYKLWRKSVFERDNYTCIWCAKKGGKLNADHIKPFSQYPELRFAIDNGRTLCEDCHKKTDTYGFKIYNLNNKK